MTDTVAQVAEKLGLAAYEIEDDDLRTIEAEHAARVAEARKVFDLTSIVGDKNAQIDALTARVAELEAENGRLRAALTTCDDAIREMFRYFYGGETRGSYDGRPERNQLRKAGDAARHALANTGEQHD